MTAAESRQRLQHGRESGHTERYVERLTPESGYGNVDVEGFGPEPRHRDRYVKGVAAGSGQWAATGQGSREVDLATARSGDGYAALAVDGYAASAGFHLYAVRAHVGAAEIGIDVQAVGADRAAAEVRLHFQAVAADADAGVAQADAKAVFVCLYFRAVGEYEAAHAEGLWVSHMKGARQRLRVVGRVANGLCEPPHRRRRFRLQPLQVPFGHVAQTLPQRD